MSPFPMEQKSQKPAWLTPILTELTPDQWMGFIRGDDESELQVFEAAMTQELLSKGIPFIFIQPGDPGHKEAKSSAIELLIQKHEADVPQRP